MQAVRIADTPNQPDSWDGAGYYLDAVALYEVSGVGLEEQLSIDHEQLTVWPNPAGEEVRFQVTPHLAGQAGNRLQVSSVVVVDMLGNAVLQQKFQGHEQSLDVSTLASGVYTLAAILQNGAQLRQRLVVQHE